MSFLIERGLFLLDFTDHHAILGTSVDAEIKDIRKRYLKIARRLHPDSYVSEGEEDRQQASQFLSKLVNPAWEKLSQEKERADYNYILKLKGQQALQQKSSIEIMSNLAKQLLTSNNPDHFYHVSLKDLANKQYDHLDQALELTAQISELNLVYLMRKESNGSTVGEGRSIYTPQPSPSPSKPPAPEPPKPPDSFVDQYYRRAKALYGKGNFAQAILELRDALKIEPNNSRCHSLLGIIHLRQNQLPMAKVHINKALQSDPHNEDALKAKQKLDELQGGTAKSTGTGKSTGTANGTNTGPQKTPPKPSKPDDKSGGLFGLFGGKKK